MAHAVSAAGHAHAFGQNAGSSFAGGQAAGYNAMGGRTMGKQFKHAEETFDYYMHRISL